MSFVMQRTDGAIHGDGWVGGGAHEPKAQLRSGPWKLPSDLHRRWRGRAAVAISPPGRGRGARRVVRSSTASELVGETGDRTNTVVP